MDLKKTLRLLNVCERRVRYVCLVQELRESVFSCFVANSRFGPRPISHTESAARGRRREFGEERGLECPEEGVGIVGRVEAADAITTQHRPSSSSQ